MYSDLSSWNLLGSACVALVTGPAAAVSLETMSSMEQPANKMRLSSKCLAMPAMHYIQTARLANLRVCRLAHCERWDDLDQTRWGAPFFSAMISSAALNSLKPIFRAPLTLTCTVRLRVTAEACTRSSAVCKTRQLAHAE